MAITACIAQYGFAQDRVAGALRAISGNTLLVVAGGAVGMRSQLWGVVAPALDSWPERVRARTVLDALVEYANVFCEPETGAATPALRSCSVLHGGFFRNIATDMAGLGWAVVDHAAVLGDPMLMGDRDEAEESARAKRLGGGATGVERS